MKILFTILCSLILTVTYSQTQLLDIDGALELGNTTGTVNNGTIRYTGTDFEGRIGGIWQSLTGGGGFWTPVTGGIAYNNVTIKNNEIYLNGTDNGSLQGGSTSIVFQFDDATRLGLYNSSDEWGPASNNSIRIGSTNFRYSEVWSVNPLNTSSDRRLKKDIVASNYGLNEILQLEPVEYKWKEGHDNTMIGLIAQDVEDIVPPVVLHHVMSEEEIKQHELDGREVTDSNKDMYSMSYSQLIPVLIKGIQEQHDIIESQEQSISSLQEQHTELKAEILELKSSLESLNKNEDHAGNK